MASLESLINKFVSVVTQDGRMIVGTLKGVDQAINLVLDKSHERVFSTDTGVQVEVLGLYIIRGDNIAVVGEVDEVEDAEIDLCCRGRRPKSTSYWRRATGSACGRRALPQERPTAYDVPARA